MPSTCLVTGGTGFLGRHLVRALEQLGHHVTVLCRQPLIGARTITADLRDPRLDLGRAPFSLVFHLAGLAHLVPHNSNQHQQFFDVNAAGTRNLLDALQRLQRLPKAVVMASTVAVYGVDQGVLLDETTAREATDPYGASKIVAEDILDRWCKDNQVSAAVARLPLLVGANAPGNFGAMLRGLALGYYFGIGSGAARRSMVLARDVATFLPRMAGASGVFHLTDGQHPSFVELEKALAAALHRRTPRRIPACWAKLGSKIGDRLEQLFGHHVPLNSRTLRKMTSTLTFSDEKARRTLNWNPTHVLESAGALIGHDDME